jgi:hypothetical protein
MSQHGIELVEALNLGINVGGVTVQVARQFVDFSVGMRQELMQRWNPRCGW